MDEIQQPRAAAGQGGGASPRVRFIRNVTLGYFLLATAWILLSDKVLEGFVDTHAMAWLSTVKGFFFVLATTVLLQLALRAASRLSHSAADGGTVFSHLSQEGDSAGRPGWLDYQLAVALPLSALLLRQALGSDNHPLFVLLVLPTVLSAMMGGLWPGLLSTAITTLGAAWTVLQPAALGDAQRDWFALAVLAGTGVAVSAVSELRRVSQFRANAYRRLIDGVLEGTSDAIFVKDLQGRYQLINRAGAAMLGKPVRDILGQDDVALFPSPQGAELKEADQAIMRRACTQNYEEALTFTDGVARHFLVTKGPLLDDAGEVAGLFGISREVTARRFSELELRQAATVFESSQEGIMVVNPQQRIVKVNPAFGRITGYEPHEVLGQSPHMLSSGRHEPSFFRTMWSCIHDNGFWRGEIWNRRKNGELFAELLSISVVRDADGAVQHYVGIFTDISKYKMHEEELNRIAHYDPLTSLPNRRLLADRLEQALRASARNRRMLAVCFLDLDGFKAINDRLGHAAGDALLLGVTQHLRHEMRAEDTLARLGGDEFVLLLSDLDSLEACGQALDRILLAVAKPVALEGGEECVTASIGVTLFPQDDADADTLLRHADQAMYVAKETGRNRYHLFDLESDRRAQQHRQMLDVLRTALAQDQFVLHFQPKVDLRDGRVVGAEALIRWQHPERGLVPPGAFLGHVAGSSLEQPLGQWVIEAAMRQAELWCTQGLDLRVSVNISAHHLLHPDFCQQLEDALRRHPGLPPGRFELEVLETAALDDMAQAVALVARCKSLGVHFALDDFGTGYSSLSYLRRLPVDVLKIDQSLVRNMLGNADDMGIVQAVVQLAGVFDREVIAEGVETLEHGTALLTMGCYLAQGYGVARPMPAPDFESWLTRWRTEAPWQRMVAPPPGSAQPASPAGASHAPALC